LKFKKAICQVSGGV